MYDTEVKQHVYYSITYFYNMSIIIRVFSPRAGPSLQAQEPRLEFCRREDFNSKLKNQGWSFTRDWIGAIVSRCFPHPPLSLADLKRSEKTPGVPTWSWGEWVCLTGSSGLHWNSPQGLHICSIMVFDQSRDPEIPIAFCPQHMSI